MNVPPVPAEAKCVDTSYIQPWCPTLQDKDPKISYASQPAAGNDHGSQFEETEKLDLSTDDDDNESFLKADERIQH